jgi:SM-20-related protein
MEHRPGDGSADTGGPCTFDFIAQALHARGYVVLADVFPLEWLSAWFLYLKALEPERFRRAGIGRGEEHQLNRFVRGDEICWLDPADPQLVDWFGWVEQLRMALNRRLFMGLFDFECHFARYPRGSFYRRHVDAFRDQERSRVLSTVLYLTPGWQPGDGGELVLYRPEGPELDRVQPAAGRLVLFLSEEFPHEVLPTRRSRYSLTGWYRVSAPSGLEPPGRIRKTNALCEVRCDPPEALGRAS